MWCAVLLLRLVEVEEHVNRCPWERSQPWPEKQQPLVEGDAVTLIAGLLTAPAAALDNSQVCEISSLCLVFLQLNWCNRELQVGCRLRLYLLWSISSVGFCVLDHTWNLPFWTWYWLGGGEAGPNVQILLYFQVLICPPCNKGPVRSIPISGSDILLILPQDLLLCPCPERQKVITLLNPKELLSETLEIRWFSPTRLSCIWWTVWCTHVDALSQVKFCRMATQNQLSKAASHPSQLCNRGLSLVIKSSVASFVVLNVAFA